MTDVYLSDLIPGGEIDSRSNTGDVDSLAHSIRQLGLILPLSVMKEGDGKGSYRVIDGNRRLAALNQIYNGTAGSTLVPVNIMQHDDIDLAIEQSIAANIERLPLHPMDQYEAFAKLATSPTEVAAHFGITDRQVRQRMALGNLHPQVREVYRTGELNERIIQQFTRLDHDSQLRILLGATNRWHMEKLLEDALDTKAIHPTSALARFVTRETYLDNGGLIEGDLFKEEDEQRWVDAELVSKLANEKIIQLKKKYLAEGWQFVELCEGWVGQDYEMEDEAGSPDDAPQEILDQIEGLQEQERAIQGCIDDQEGEITEEQERQLEDIEASLYILTDPYRRWTDEQRGRLGVVIDQNWHVHEGAQRRVPVSGPKDIPDAAGSEPAEKGLAMSLLNDIDNALTHGAAQVIAREQDMAIRLLVLQLLHNSYQFKLDPMYSFGVRTDSALDNPLGSDEIGNLVKPIAKAKTLEGQMKALWKLDDYTIHQILAWFTAGALRKQHRGSDLILYLDKLGKIETRKHYTPTVENFFGRLSKDQLQKLADMEKIEIDVGPLKKGVAAEKICAALPDTWLPEAMRPTKVV